MKSTKTLPRTIARWLSALLSPRPVLGVVGLPRYLKEWRQYGKQNPEAPLRWSDSYPCLTDWTRTTPFDPHYFYQSAWLARKLGEALPEFHVDVGSSVGAIAVISGRMPTLFMDFRPLDVRLSNLTSVAANIEQLPLADHSVRSISALHVIEHIGLGRYGDQLDPEGSRKGAVELARVLAPGGTLYVSLPVGRQRECFNAHRIHATETIVDYFRDLTLISFCLVDDQGRYFENISLSAAAGLDYGCGMFEFSRAIV